MQCQCTVLAECQKLRLMLWRSKVVTSEVTFEGIKWWWHSFIHLWHAPLWVCSAKRRHQSPEWTILSHFSCFVQGEVHWFQVLLSSLHPHSTGGLLWFSKGWAVKICLASDSSDIRAVWPSRERRQSVIHAIVMTSFMLWHVRNRRRYYYY